MKFSEPVLLLIFFKNHGVFVGPSYKYLYRIGFCFANLFTPFKRFPFCHFITMNLTVYYLDYGLRQTNNYHNSVKQKDNALQFFSNFTLKNEFILKVTKLVTKAFKLISI